MEVGRVEETEVAEGKVVVTWTSAMSIFMLKHLADVVTSDARTSSGFKMVHYNACARALNDHFRQRMTGGQISNHHRTVKKKFAKIEQIKNTVNGALWDDDQCIITLEHDMALTYINLQLNTSTNQLKTIVRCKSFMATVWQLASGQKGQTNLLVLIRQGLNLMKVMRKEM